MTQYYLAINGQQTGPFSKDELRSKSISPDTLVWCAGMPEWLPAGKVAALADIFEEVIIIDNNGPAAGMPPLSEQQEDASWFAMMGDRRIGPSTISELINMGISPNTPVWHEGFPDWMAANRVQEIMVKINASRPTYGQNPQYGQQQPNYGQNPQYGQQQPNYGQNPQYGQQQPNYGQNPQYGQQQPNYGQNPQYGQQQPNYGQNPQYGQQPNYGQNSQFGRQPGYGNQAPYSQRKDWMTLAIISAIAGLLCSCIGAIFGIIGIVQANKANKCFAAGMEMEGESANSTAKVMTIIAFVCAGLGLVVNGINFMTNLF